MKKIILLLAVFAMLGFVGCDNGTTDDGNGGGSGQDISIIDSVLGQNFTNGTISIYFEKEVGNSYFAYRADGQWISGIQHKSGNVYSDYNGIHIRITFNDDATQFQIEELSSFGNSAWALPQYNIKNGIYTIVN